MELIFYAGSSLLEGPIWDVNNKLIYCVSIEQGLIYQINRLTNHYKMIKLLKKHNMLWLIRF